MKTPQELADNIAFIAHPDTRDLVAKRALLFLEERDREWQTKYENCPQCTGLREEFRKEIVEAVEGMALSPTLCGKCNLNGKLCKGCYANRRANKVLNDILALLTNDKKV